MGTIRIDDGTKEYKIENQYGQEICRIHIRPADLSLLDRYEAISESMVDALDPLRSIALRVDGTATDEENWAALKQAEETIVAKFKELLDTDDVADIFKTRRAFSSVGGQFFCEIVLLAIGDVIKEEFEKEAAATRERISKYLPAEESTDAGAAAENG